MIEGKVDSSGTLEYLRVEALHFMKAVLLAIYRKAV
jgi:hypothetical protein